MKLMSRRVYCHAGKVTFSRLSFDFPAAAGHTSFREITWQWKRISHTTVTWLYSRRFDGLWICTQSLENCWWASFVVQLNTTYLLFTILTQEYVLSLKTRSFTVCWCMSVEVKLQFDITIWFLLVGSLFFLFILISFLRPSVLNNRRTKTNVCR